MKIRPIAGEDPGICQVIHSDGRMCSEEAAIVATLPVPGLDAVVDVLLCRIDWAEAAAAEEIDLNRIDTGEAALGPEPGRAHMTAEY